MKKLLAFAITGFVVFGFKSCGGSADAASYPDEQIVSEYEEENNEELTAELNAELAGEYKGVAGIYGYSYYFYEDGTYEWVSSGGITSSGSYRFDGEKIVMTPVEGGSTDEYAYDADKIIDEYGNEFYCTRDV
jgi:hypothetical protein